MPRKSKNSQQKAAGIAKARASRHPSRTSDSALIPDTETNDATTPETSPSPGPEIITNPDYTFETLKTNLPKALGSVQLSTIRKWEHQMIWWMEAYRDGKSAKDAQFDVKKYGSRKYTSHRKASETVARRFDEPSLTN